jgi:hypothetical protein
MTDPDTRMRLAKMRVDELICEAERVRLARSARPPRTLLRVRVLRLAARGLRVQCEIDFETARASSR